MFKTSVSLPYPTTFLDEAAPSRSFLRLSSRWCFVGSRPIQQWLYFQVLWGFWCQSTYKLFMHLLDETLNCQLNLLQFVIQEKGRACVLAWVSGLWDLLCFSQAFRAVISPAAAVELRDPHSNNGWTVLVICGWFWAVLGALGFVKPRGKASMASQNLYF